MLVRLVLLITTLTYVATAYAAVTVTVNGSNHTIPQTNEKGWGNNVTAWIQAISANTLQPSGGTFTLTADANFGANFGLVSKYYKSGTSNPAGTGVLRLANDEGVAWRNAANSANLLLKVNSSNALEFNGAALTTGTSGSFQDSTFSLYDNGDATKLIAFQASGITTGNTRTITMADANVDLGDVATATNANTASKIVKRDGSGNFSAGTITASLTGNVTGDVTGNASTATALAANPADCASDTYATAIAASGALTCGTVTNAGLAGSIAASKLVGSDIATVGTITSGTWSGTTIALNKGGTGQTTKAAAFDALSPMSASGDIIYGGASGTGTRLAKGSDGDVLTLASGVPSWATPATATVVSTATQRVERAKLNCDSSSAITSQSGSWISAIGNISSGACSVTIAGGVFSSAPTCVFNVETVAGKPAIPGMTVTSSTAFAIDCVTDANVDCGAYEAYVECMGED